MDGHALAEVDANAASLCSDADEAALVERAKRDRQAFAQLYLRYYEAIGRYLSRRTGDEHATEDLIAETFLTVLRRLPSFRFRGVPFRYWLYRVATNTANRWARRRYRWASEPLPADEGAASAADQHDASRVNREQVQRALLALSPAHQAVLVLHYVEGLSVEDAAAVLGCRPGTVKSRLSRAREALRDRLATWS